MSDSMRQRRFPKTRHARWRTASADVYQGRLDAQALKQWPRRFAKTFERPHMPYRMLMLVATIIVSVLDRSMPQTLLPAGSILFMKLRQAIHRLKRWPRRGATALQQPHVQYRLMLLLAVLLILLIGWSGGFSTVLHLPLVIGAGRMSAKG